MRFFSNVHDRPTDIRKHGVTMQTGLLTLDGFPRSDIDVAQIRTTRARIVRLKNDYKWLMEKIEKGLHEHHATLASGGKDIAANGSGPSSRAATAVNGAGTDSLTSRPQPLIQAPFCKVNSIAHGSPAEDSGLKVGDKITQFGSINFTNHERLMKVAQEVQSNESRPILLKVLRVNESGGASTSVELSLTPRNNWGGRGMLGCHLLPLMSSSGFEDSIQNGKRESATAAIRNMQKSPSEWPIDYKLRPGA
ncbi:hypothetical protein MRB53_041462 [Persea americana]|nr:hypothetical protein MRB53_041462 [Persea americana]